ncbi:MAG: DinB family protein [bacterium]|jgi:hypothetical protein|nr:DinB family protein [bacterium]
MLWKEMLAQNLESTYLSTEMLIDWIQEDDLDWKPAQNNNWMTTRQVLHHLVNSSGPSFNAFIHGEWGIPEDFDYSALPQEEKMPPATAMPFVSSVAEAQAMLAQDKQMAFDLLAQTSETDLATKQVAAPWEPDQPKILGHYLLDMINHAQQHKYQLFYYLKLQGKPVNTFTLHGLKEI